jgi:hypothetical protein
MKTIFTTLLILFFTSLSFSQRISLGPEIGLNVIPIENTDIGYTHQMGYHIGGQLKYHFSKNFNLSTGLFLSQKKKGYSSFTTESVATLLDGFSNLSGAFGSPDTSGLDSLLSIPGLNTSITESIKGVRSELFIEIPILANYQLKNINFYAGPYLGILIAANKKEELTTDIPILDLIDLESLGLGGVTTFFLPSSGVEVSNISGTDGLRKIDLGLNLGIGYEMNNLHFNFMYAQGLLDYRDDNEGESLEVLKLYRFSIAYAFDLKKKKPHLDANFK